MKVPGHPFKLVNESFDLSKTCSLDRYFSHKREGPLPKETKTKDSRVKGETVQNNVLTSP